VGLRVVCTANGRGYLASWEGHPPRLALAASDERHVDDPLRHRRRRPATASAAAHPANATRPGSERIEAAVERREVDQSVGNRRRELEQRSTEEHPALLERRHQIDSHVSHPRVVEAVSRPLNACGRPGGAPDWRGRRRSELGRHRADNRVRARTQDMAGKQCAGHRDQSEDEYDESQLPNDVSVCPALAPAGGSRVDRSLNQTRAREPQSSTKGSIDVKAASKRLSEPTETLWSTDVTHVPIRGNPTAGPIGRSSVSRGVAATSGSRRGFRVDSRAGYMRDAR
jgi:hypothetical protein